jgi:putative endonuclease
MSDRRQRLGRRGEDLAVEHLAGLGYTIVARNWRCPAGELDIVARHGDTLVLLEVRTRRGRAFGLPEESITPTKRARLLACGEYLTAELAWAGAVRIDLVAIEIGPADTVQRLELISDAVER